MVNLTTNEVRVIAQSTFQEQYSEPLRKQFVFSYRIELRNLGDRPVQLLSRRWEVIDGTGTRKIVEGEGVVGQRPVILPGHSFEYTSWVQLNTPIGAMEGLYVVSREDRRGRDQYLEVTVPKFTHVAPELLN